MANRRNLALGIISAIGFTLCLILLLLSWLESEGIYIYNQTANDVFSFFLHLSFIGLGCLIALFVIQIIVCLKNNRKLAALLLGLFCLIYGLSMSASSTLQFKTSRSLVDTVVVDKDRKNQTITVQSGNIEGEIVLKVSAIEWVLFTEGDTYAYMGYDGNENTGILTDIEPYT